jgi:WD40 repeat protein
VDGEILWVFASPDNRTAIVLTSDRFALVDLDTGRTLHQGETDLVPFLGAFSSDGRHFGIGGFDGEVRVLDVVKGRWLAPPHTVHNGKVNVTAAGASTFVSGGADGAIILWDAATGAQGERLPGPSAGVGRQGRMLADGHTVRIVSSDWTVESWDTRPATWIDAACAIAGRNLTREEWTEAFGDRPYEPSCPTGPAGG